MMRSHAAGRVAIDHDSPPDGGVPMPSKDLAALCQRLAVLADREGRSTEAMRDSVAELDKAGVLKAALPRDRAGRDLALTADGGVAAARLLIAIGSVDLPLARLFEGHLNALRLITLHGREPHLDRAEAAISRGGLLGVWGADGDRPVSLENDLLDGAKIFCSGLGTVVLAVVPVRSGDRQQLILVHTSEAQRADAHDWNMQGMRATHSGSFTLDGLPVGDGASDALTLGEADAYRREPGFLAGVWRLAAAELGGVFGLLEAAREVLAARGRLDDRLQLTRLGDCLIAAHAARSLTLDAARFSEGPSGRETPQRAVQLAIFARLAAERAADETLTAVGRSLGLAAYAGGTPVERRMRDLATYIRQMTPDRLREQASLEILSDASALADSFDVRD